MFLLVVLVLLPHLSLSCSSCLCLSRLLLLSVLIVVVLAFQEGYVEKCVSHPQQLPLCKGSSESLDLVASSPLFLSLSFSLCVSIFPPPPPLPPPRRVVSLFLPFSRVQLASRPFYVLHFALRCCLSRLHSFIVSSSYPLPFSSFLFSVFCHFAFLRLIGTRLWESTSKQRNRVPRDSSYFPPSFSFLSPPAPPFSGLCAGKAVLLLPPCSVLLSSFSAFPLQLLIQFDVDPFWQNEHEVVYPADIAVASAHGVTLIGWHEISVHGSSNFPAPPVCV